MRISKRYLLPATLSVVTTLAACSMNVKKGDNNEDKNVDIKTPLGGLHVSNDANVQDTGLAVYPGARPKPKGKGDDDEKNANVNISGFGFGLKVVALEFESDDPPSKVIAFYQDQLKKYGKVLQCHNNSREGSHTYNGHGSNELKCEGDDSGKNTEMKAGTEDNQHIVSVQPNGSGSNFALVYVRTHGKQDSI